MRINTLTTAPTAMPRSGHQWACPGSHKNDDDNEGDEDDYDDKGDENDEDDKSDEDDEDDEDDDDDENDEDDEEAFIFLLPGWTTPCSKDFRHTHTLLL